MQKAIGFIDLGHIGQPMVHNLLNAHYHLRVYDKDPHRRAYLASLDQRAAIVSTIADAVEPDGVVLIMVDNDTSLFSIALYRDGILACLGQGGVHVSLSTVSLELAQSLALIYAEQGATYISATGGDFSYPKQL